MEADQGQSQQPPEAQPAQPTFTDLPLAILATIKTAQLQNGLKHGDYSRYRQYCSRRLRCLYKATKFLHGKGRYVKRRLDVAAVTDVRHLHIALVSAERAWAQAMALKQEAEAEGGGAAPAPAKRRRGLRRLRKAAAWAATLARLAGATADTRGGLEAEAYAAWMSGNALMEGEAQWEAARAAFARSKALFSELARAGDPDSAKLWGGMLQELEPALRYCAYQIGRAGGAPGDPDALASLTRMGSEPGAGVGGEAGGGLLQSKLASLAAEAQSAQAAATSSFEWRGLRCGLPLEKLRVPLHSAAELAASLAGAMDTDGSSPEDALPQHDRLINAYSEARGAARSSIAAAEAGATAAGGGADASSGPVDVDELRRLDTALTGAMLEASLARGEAAAAAAAGRFEAALARLAAGKGAAGPAGARGGGKDGRPAKPEDLVRLYTTLSQHAHELEEHSGHMGGKAGEALAAAAAARASAYAAWRAYYAAHAALAGGDERLAEAAGLFRRAGERAAAAQEAIQELPRAEASCQALLPGLAALRDAAAGYLLVSGAEAAAAGAAGAAAATSGLEGLGLAGGGGGAGAQQAGSLLDALDCWESFGGAGPAAKGARLAGGGGGAPFPLAPIAPRPIMVDTAADEVAYRDVAHRCARRRRGAGDAAQQGTFARLGAGLWRGWGAS